MDTSELAADLLVKLRDLALSKHLGVKRVCLGRSDLLVRLLNADWYPECRDNHIRIALLTLQAEGFISTEDSMPVDGRVGTEIFVAMTNCAKWPSNVQCNPPKVSSIAPPRRSKVNVTCRIAETDIGVKEAFTSISDDKNLSPRLTGVITAEQKANHALESNLQAIRALNAKIRLLQAEVIRLEAKTETLLKGLECNP